MHTKAAGICFLRVRLPYRCRLSWLLWKCGKYSCISADSSGTGCGSYDRRWLLCLCQHCSGQRQKGGCPPQRGQCGHPASFYGIGRAALVVSGSRSADLPHRSFLHPPGLCKGLIRFTLQVGYGTIAQNTLCIDSRRFVSCRERRKP